MKSLRKRVFAYMKDNPEKSSNKEVLEAFRDENSQTITTYRKQYRRNNKPKPPLNIKNELEKIVMDYKQPASSRIQAIRELNAMRREEGVQTGDEIDPYNDFMNRILKEEEEKSLKLATELGEVKE